MAFMLGMGTCINCNRPFTFNPHYVPSIRTDPNDPSSREPVCKDCIDRENERRRNNPHLGLPALTYHPKAYTAEEEL